MQSATTEGSKVGQFEPSSSQVRAQMIMGSNFFGVRDAIKYFGVVPSIQDFAELYEVPFHKDMLAELSKTHILVAVFPLSLTEINIRTHNKGIFCGPDLYKKDFSDDDCSLASWMLIKREPVEDSFLKNWSEQEELVYSSCDDEDSPGVQVLAYAIVGHYLASGEKLFKNCFVRTSSIGPRKNTHVDVGPFGLHGLGISYNPDDRKAPNMGIASFRDFYFNLFFLPRRAMCPGLLFTI